jgi:hypothetical protein
MMKTRRIAAVLLFTFLPVTVSLPAYAQPTEDALTLQARTRFKEGVEAFDKGKYEEARLAFLQAYTLKKHPAVLLNLAQSSAKSNHPLEAAKYFQQFLREATTATPQQRKDAETGLAEVRKQLARIDVVAPPGTEISLDDQGKVGTTPFDALDVEPGQHTVKSPTQSVTVVAVVGQKVEARFGSAAAPPPAPAAAPATPAAPAPTETAAPPEPQQQPAASAEVSTRRTNIFSPPANMTPVYIGLGVGAAGLVTAVIFAAFKSDAQSKANTVANNIRTEVGKRPPLQAQGICNNPSATDFAAACKTLRDNNDKVDTDAMIANVALGVMGVGLAVAGVWYLAGPKRGDASPTTGAARAPSRPVLAPYAGWGNGGLSLTGEF